MAAGHLLSLFHPPKALLPLTPHTGRLPKKVVLMGQKPATLNELPAVRDSRIIISG